MDGSKFKVIIVGGSIAGLSLAHCLHKAGIDSIVLEKRSELVCDEGASVAIMPNGGRILEQLGLYDAVEELVEPMHVAHVRFSDGFQFSSPYPKLMHEAFGFPMVFLERQQLLRIMYRSYPEKSKIYVNQNVVRVEHLGHDGVVVYTQDGQSHKGDLVVGADGVHSHMRTRMWHFADMVRPGMIPGNEKKGMTVSYACIFGISSAVPELKIGHLHLSIYSGISFIVAPGSRGRLSWFVVLKLDKTYQYGSAPRFSVIDIASRCEQLADMYIWKDVQFAQLWQSRQAFSMVHLEENIFETWYCGRIVCIGDSMHKMTPNLAQGANCSIEDAASLANKLHEALQANKCVHKPSDQQIEHLLRQFNTTQIARMSRIYKASRVVVRLQTGDNILFRMILRYYVPYAGNVPSERAMKILENAVVLRFIPLPQRSGPRWLLPGKKEMDALSWAGIMAASPLLALALFFVTRLLQLENQAPFLSVTNDEQT